MAQRCLPFLLLRRNLRILVINLGKSSLKAWVNERQLTTEWADLAKCLLGTTSGTFGGHGISTIVVTCLLSVLTEIVLILLCISRLQVLVGPTVTLGSMAHTCPRRPVAVPSWQ